MTAPAGGAPDYNNRFFVSSAAETAGPDHEVPVGHYHQAGPIVWAEFRGGKVLIGRLVGTCDPDGTLHLAYCQALDGGTVVAGECTSTPEFLPDGRIRLREEWRRLDAAGSSGVSYIEEVAAARRAVLAEAVLSPEGA
ncbi:hypothetical protein ABZ876_25200 [Streptomyces sp. NPDC046931]|uniref:hypothetical protein n=1 Tax=Streptomyces sp. NPDC046931 TaxID=3154806 RepID=UPI00340724A2